MPDAKLTAIDSNALPWEERPNEKIGRSLYRKNLIIDPDTGMEVRLVRYPAGAVNPTHTHPCAHGAATVLAGPLQRVVRQHASTSHADQCIDTQDR